MFYKFFKNKLKKSNFNQWFNVKSYTNIHFFLSLIYENNRDQLIIIMTFIL